MDNSNDLTPPMGTPLGRLPAIQIRRIWQPQAHWIELRIFQSAATPSMELALRIAGDVVQVREHIAVILSQVADVVRLQLLPDISTNVVGRDVIWTTGYVKYEEEVVYATQRQICSGGQHASHRIDLLR